MKPGPERPGFFISVFMERPAVAGILLYLVLCHQAGEMFERPVKRFFGIVGEATGGKFPGLQVVAEAITAKTLS